MSKKSETSCGFLNVLRKIKRIGFMMVLYMFSEGQADATTVLETVEFSLWLILYVRHKTS